MTMNSDSLKNRLQLADETISILRSSNSQLDRNLSVLQSDFSVLESLLIESGQTLQKLQEMYHKEKEVCSMLSAALEKANCRNADLSDLYEEERKKNKMIIPSPDTVNQQIVVKTDYDVAAAVSNGELTSPIKLSGYSATRMHDYHVTIRDSLRDMAESLCDELVRVEEDIIALEPLLRLGQQEESDKPPPSSSSSSAKQSQAAKNRERRSAGPDFVFGSPSSRLPMKSGEGLVDEDEEEGEEEEEEDEDREHHYEDREYEAEEGEEEYETVTPEGGDEEKGDASALRNSDNDNDGAEIYPDLEDYLYEGDEEREGGGGRGGGRDPGSDDEFDSNMIEQEVWDDIHEDGDQEGSGDDATLL